MSTQARRGPVWTLLGAHRMLSLGARTAAEAALVVFPHGGQRTARWNAWGALVADSQRAAARQLALEAVEAVSGPGKLAAGG